REEVLFLARRALIEHNDEEEEGAEEPETTIHGRSPRGEVSATTATDLDPIITIDDVDYDHVELLRVLYLPPEQAALERAAIEEGL
ncbi:MAG: hypothetical protein ACOCXA_09375, partial [Planctomycetota bacterium]